MKFIQVCVLGTVLSASVYASHPSFDCAKVKNDSAEATICASDTLMALDNEMAALYKEARKVAQKDDMLKAIQRGWIKGRNECWKETDQVQCMIDAYNVRIDELKEEYHLNSDNTVKTDKASSVSTGGFDKTLKLQGISFHVKATNEGSLNTLTITPSGLSGGNEVMKQEIDGSVTGAEVADINADGFPEVYVYVTSAGSGSYGSLVAYASNKNRSITPIFLPELSDDKKLSEGYMGHDVFTIMENRFARRFPVYLKDDPNCCPKGGTRQIEYELAAGEAGWILKVNNSTDIK